MNETSHQMYERLLSLPLFLGMSQDDLHEVAAHTPLAFSTYDGGTTIVPMDAPCEGLIFLIQGEAESHIESDDRQWSLDEQVMAPYIHQPEHLFGWHQRYTRSLRAKGTCHVLRIKKGDIDHLVRQFQTIRFNLLNILCIRTQRHSRQAWRIRPESIEGKLGRWLEELSDHPSGAKTLHIKQVCLARLLGESRLNLSRCLHAMAKEGKLEMIRGGLRF